MDALAVTNLGKAYKKYPAKWARLCEWFDPRGKEYHHKHWVLQGINFNVKVGEAIGVIGVNGAGKSTLLKMITGTTKPTVGDIQIQGRVAAMLELGMGFDPDFTGRQNAYMAGQLAGIARDKMDDLIPEIEKFADIGEYFDQPVRVYSSGMQARVAFAVATSSIPDILIVDEALSVGDIAFQAKCIQRMRSLQEKGVTILFVSHSLNQVRQFCSKCLYLADGRVRAWGAADDVCDLFQNDLAIPKDKKINLDNSEKLDVYDCERDPDLRKNSVEGNTGGSLELEFLNFKIFNDKNIVVKNCNSGELLKFRASIIANKNVPAGAAVGLLFADSNGYHIMACNTNYYDKFLPAMKKGEVVFVEWSIKIPFALGEFRIDSGIKPDPFSSIFYDRVFCLSTLSVSADVELLKRNFGGFLFIDATVNITTEKN
jgi:lipopolysaccharide transport system ATP-binding protein